MRPLRINVGELVGDAEHAWVKRQLWPERLRLSSENPANLGWLLFR